VSWNRTALLVFVFLVENSYFCHLETFNCLYFIKNTGPMILVRGRIWEETCLYVISAVCHWCDFDKHFVMLAKLYQLLSLGMHGAGIVVHAERSAIAAFDTKY